MNKFLVKNLECIAGFAAVNFEAYGRGAVFLFTKITMSDLLDSGSDSHLLDRHFVLTWGSEFEHSGVRCTAAELAEPFQNESRSLAKLISTMSKSRFPMVFVSDPSGNLFPQVADLVRGYARAASG